MIEVNGVTLPDLPSDVDRSVYPYGLISETSMTGVYALTFTSEPIYYIPSSSKYNTINSCNCCIYTYGMSGTEKWTLFDNELIAFSETPIWTEYNVLNSETGEVVVRASTSDDTFDVTTLVKQSILDEYPKCVILTKEESNGTNIIVCYSDKPLYLDEEETTVRRVSGTLGVVESYLRTSDEELLVQGTKTLYEVFPAVLYTKKYDINKDGVLDKADSDAIHNHFMGSATITDAETLENADMNKDGVIDTTDAVLLQNIIESGEGSGFAIAWSNYTLDVLYKIFKGTLTNIADSIRAKTGKTDKVPPEIMPEEIESISDGATMEDFEEAFLGGEW